MDMLFQDDSRLRTVLFYLSSVENPSVILYLLIKDKMSLLNSKMHAVIHENHDDPQYMLATVSTIVPVPTRPLNRKISALK